MPQNSKRMFVFGRAHTLLANLTTKPIEQILPLLTLFSINPYYKMYFLCV
jgi:hypothetical protein